MIQRICGWCNQYIDDTNWAEFEEEEDRYVPDSAQRYCNNEDWDTEGGTCWQQRICQDAPEFTEWLSYGYQCDGCQGDEYGECCCTTDSWGLDHSPVKYEWIE